MTKLDPYEAEVLVACESGKLKPVGTRAEPARMRAAARATAIKDRRVNKRLSSDDLHGIQAKALTGGIALRGNDFAKAGVQAALAG